MIKDRFYRCMSIMLSVLFLFLSPAFSFTSAALFTPGEHWEMMKNAISFIGTEIGTVFSGSMQDILLNYEAFTAWVADRYREGYDGTPWNLEEYYTKECIRNPDGTLTLSDRLVDDTVAWIKEVLDTNSGYYLVKTKGLNNVSPSEFWSKTSYENFLSLLDSNYIIYFDGVGSNHFPDEGYVPYFTYFILDGYDFTFTSYAVSSGLYHQFHIYKDWEKKKTLNKRLHDNNVVHDTVQLEVLSIDRIVTRNGDYIKLFKTDSAMKEHDVGYQSYYAGDKFLNYDSGQDNSITVDSDTLNNNNWITNNSNIYNDISSTVINNNNTNITNGGSGLTEGQIKDIVDSVLDKYKPDSGGSDSGDGGGSGSGDNGGSGGGLTAILEALGKLLDFLLTLIGKLLSVILDFLTKVLGLLEGLTAFTGPFATLLSGLMPFVPSELWDVIIAGITLSVIVVVIKAWKG